MNFPQRVKIADEVLDGAEREDYGIDEIPAEVMAEVQTVLSSPEINVSVAANLSVEKAAKLNAALASDDPSRLRTALKDREIFSATHFHVESVRREYEAQEEAVESLPERSEETAPSNGERATDQTEELLDDLLDEFAPTASVKPTAVRSQEASEIQKS